MRSRMASALLPASAISPPLQSAILRSSVAGVALLADRHAVRRRASAAARSRSDWPAVKPSTATAAPRASAARNSLSVSGRTSGVSANITRMSSAPRAIALRAASTACAVPRRLLLLEDLRLGRERARLCGHRVVIGPDHHGDVAAARLDRRAEHMREQRASADRVQRLRHGRAHAGALAGRQHDRKACSSLHPFSAHGVATLAAHAKRRAALPASASVLTRSRHAMKASIAGFC